MLRDAWPDLDDDGNGFAQSVLRHQHGTLLFLDTAEAGQPGGVAPIGVIEPDAAGGGWQHAEVSPRPVSHNLPTVTAGTTIKSVR